MNNYLHEAIKASERLLPYEKKQLIMILTASLLGKIAVGDTIDQIRIDLNNRPYQE